MRCKTGPARVSRLCPGEMLEPVVVGGGGLLPRVPGLSFAPWSLGSWVQRQPAQGKPSPYVCGMDTPSQPGDGQEADRRGMTGRTVSATAVGGILRKNCASIPDFVIKMFVRRPESLIWGGSR